MRHCQGVDGGNGASVTDLRISYNDLESTSATLGGLIKDLENLQPDQSRYDKAMGSGDIAGAMDNFAGNWSIHRKKLLGNMQNLRSMVRAALTEFPKTDQKAAGWLTKK
jgi:hypothetical protein